MSLTSQSKALEYNTESHVKPTLPDVVSDFITSNVGIPKNDARPITYDRIFYPTKVKDMYATVGKAFLVKHYREAWESFNKGMVKIRELFDMGFCRQDKEDFSFINLRNSREKSDQILDFIKENMEHIPPLHFGKLGELPWRIEDVYMKVLEHRSYIRKCGKGMVDAKKCRCYAQGNNIDQSLGHNHTNPQTDDIPPMESTQDCAMSNASTTLHKEDTPRSAFYTGLVQGVITLDDTDEEAWLQGEVPTSYEVLHPYVNKGCLDGSHDLQRSQAQR
ncbi:hypothetical protein GOP47_0031187, partial [Adiantum capillus-veneris]